MFRKLLDQGQAGDNVGILSRGTSEKEVERGQVLKQNGISPQMKFTAEIGTRRVEEGGRHTHFFRAIDDSSLQNQMLMGRDLGAACAG